MVDSQYARKAAPVELLSQPGTMVARLECAECGQHEEWRIVKLPGPDIVQRHFATRGWRVKRRPKCPDCSSKRKEPDMPTTNVSQIATPKQSPATAADSDAARKNKRLVIVALEDYYDEAECRYRDGHTDAAVAKELDLAPGFVALVREEFYGKMAPPTEIDDLRQRLASVETLASELRKRLDALAAKNGWQ